MEDWIGSRVAWCSRPLRTAPRSVYIADGRKRATFPDLSYCWAMYLRVMKRNLEFGEVVPHDDRLTSTTGGMDGRQCPTAVAEHLTSLPSFPPDRSSCATKSSSGGRSGDGAAILPFRRRVRTWLASNHAKRSELLVGLYKKLRPIAG